MEAHRFAACQQLGRKDCILYALGVGLGGDLLDAAQLRFLYEEGLQAPTMPVVMAYPGFWLKDPATGIDWVRVVHGVRRAGGDEDVLRRHRLVRILGSVLKPARPRSIADFRARFA